MDAKTMGLSQEYFEVWKNTARSKKVNHEGDVVRFKGKMYWVNVIDWVVREDPLYEMKNALATAKCDLYQTYPHLEDLISRILLSDDGHVHKTIYQLLKVAGYDIECIDKTSTGGIAIGYIIYPDGDRYMFG